MVRKCCRYPTVLRRIHQELLLRLLLLLRVVLLIKLTLVMPLSVKPLTPRLQQGTEKQLLPELV
jgi:hypothetical protein